MSNPKCTQCGNPTRKVSNVNKLFSDKYIVSDANMFVCKKCGEEYLTAHEYERIRRKIEAIEANVKIPAVYQVMAKAKFLVL